MAEIVIEPSHTFSNPKILSGTLPDSNLALLYDTQGQYSQAESLLKRSLAIYEKALGPNHPDVATSLNNLAELHRTQGQYSKAEPLYKRSLAIFEKVLGRTIQLWPGASRTWLACIEPRSGCWRLNNLRNGRRAFVPNSDNQGIPFDFKGRL
jgi:tetratricopeptide (TPR) repeat protein